MKLSSPRGTGDIYGEDVDYRNFVINIANRIFEVFNYREIITPAFEYTEVFSRSIGEGTDIVQKEMYTFPDRKGRSLTLRPEGTASIIRSVVENKLYSETKPLKLFYIGNMFRYERPQKGRMREFWQLGVESIGSDNPVLDAEVIWILNLLYKKLGFKKLVLTINSIGCEKCRSEFIREFKKNLKKSDLKKLCIDCRERFKKNPLRIFDCKKSSCTGVVAEAPDISSFLCSECKKNFKEVSGYLKKLKVEYKIDTGLVRGFDYYTGTIFEMISEDLKSAQNALGGGGRYDNMIAEFLGTKLSYPTTGLSFGLDVITDALSKMKKDERKTAVKVYVIPIKTEKESINVLNQLRKKGINADIDLNSRGISKNLDYANSYSTPYVLFIGKDELKKGKLKLKNMQSMKSKKVKII